MYLNSTFERISKIESLNKAQEMVAKGYAFVQLLATRTDKGIDLLYTYRKYEKMLNFKIEGIGKEDVIASITPVCFNAFVFENEAHDLFGVHIQGINIDFAGKFYDVAADQPMTIISPELKARKERGAKVAKAKAAAAAKKEMNKSRRRLTTKKTAKRRRNNG